MAGSGRRFWCDRAMIGLGHTRILPTEERKKGGGEVKHKGVILSPKYGSTRDAAPDSTDKIL